MREVFTYIWEYKVADAYQKEFLKLYGHGGGWDKFFSRADGYLGTDLHQNEEEQCFVTVDYWISEEARDLHRANNSDEFNILDKQGELFTEWEKLIGEFNVQTDRFDMH